MTKYSITVSRAELARGLKLITVGVHRNAAIKIRFSLVNDFLEIMGPGAAHSIPAKGTWPPAILADAGVLKRVASRLPTSEPMVLKVENSRLYIGSFSVEATVLDIAPTDVQLPIGATAAEVLTAIEQLGEARLAGSIGMQAIENAREELAARIDRAVRALEPYGVAQPEVARLVSRTMGAKATSRAQSDCWSCPTHDAILEFAKGRYSALTRRAAFQLQRIKASGVYGDDYRHKTLWDEYCHEVQEGPYDLLDDAWDKTLGPVLRAIVDAIPRHEAALLTIGAIWDLDEEFESAPGVIPDLIQRNLQQMLSKMAGARDMSRFDPTLS